MPIEPILAQVSSAALLSAAPEPLFSPEGWRLALAGMAFVYGLLVGSFLNVCIYRVPAGLSIVTPRSYCYSCGTMVIKRDNVPVLSYIALGGCCRHCGAPFSPRYMLIELLAGFAFAAIAWAFAGTTPETCGPNVGMAAYMVFAGFLIVATFTDLDHFIIPDGVSVGSGAAGVGLALAAGAAGYYGLGGQHHAGLIVPVAHGWPLAQWFPFLGQGTPASILANSLAGALFAAGGLYGIGVIGKIIFRKEAMGMGDVKLMLGIGAFLGLALTVVAFFVACCLGAFFAILGIVWQKAILRRKAEGPLRGSFQGAEGPIARARAAELARLDAKDRADGEPWEGPSEDGSEFGENGDGEEPISLDEPTEDERLDAARDAAKLWAPEALGKLFAKESRKKRPYASSHLPFGPYLALGALLVLLFHVPIIRFVDEQIGLFQPLANRPVPRFQYVLGPGAAQNNFAPAAAPQAPRKVVPSRTPQVRFNNFAPKAP